MENGPESDWCKFLPKEVLILSLGVLRKRCYKNMQQIYRRTPMPKCDFSGRLLLLIQTLSKEPFCQKKPSVDTLLPLQRFANLKYKCHMIIDSTIKLGHVSTEVWLYANTR